MKKLPILFLGIILLCGFAGCASGSVDKTKPVFETENISKITFYAEPNHPDGIEVPDEYAAEIADWLGTFVIGEKVKGNALRPGSNSISVQIEYSDGTIVKNGLSTFRIGKETYYMKFGQAPEYYLNMINQP